MTNDDRQLTTQNNRGNSNLHDNGLRAGNLIDQSIRRLDQDQVKALGQEAAKEALRLQVKQTEQNLDYVTGKKGTEDHIDAWNMIDKSGKLTRQKIESEIKTGAGKMRIESTSGATCFIASVAYENPNHPDVMFLRWYRDNVMLNSAKGRIFISMYWKFGPYAARAIKPFYNARKLAKFVISKIVRHLG